MGGGFIVPLHRASIVVVPEIGLRMANNDQHRELVEESDPSRAIVSFDWVTDCVEQDRLLDLKEYKLRYTPSVSLDNHDRQRPSPDAASAADSLKTNKRSSIEDGSILCRR